jgi:DNA-binding MarR family transcriptional regulator
VHDPRGRLPSGATVAVEPRSPELASLLAHAERAVSGAIAAVVEREGHTLERWRVLDLLADGGGRPMSEIAAHVLLPPPTLTKVVDRLVEDALVHRHVDPSDRRRVLVLLTARGRAAHRRLLRVVEARLAEVFEEVPGGDRGHLAQLLDAIRR